LIGGVVHEKITWCNDTGNWDIRICDADFTRMAIRAWRVGSSKREAERRCLKRNLDICLTFTKAGL
jgi:hypothetical protein